MKASRIALPSAVLFVMAGMIWGIVMAASRDHSAMPAHAHLNLLGWVSLFLFGIFYQLHPALDASRAALAQVGIWIVGTIVLALGVGLLSKGSEIGEPLATAGSLVVLLDMAWFGWLVLRSGAPRSLLSRAMPAE
jgi:drug/metabolite transporter superfamily protein YnfA